MGGAKRTQESWDFFASAIMIFSIVYGYILQAKKNYVIFSGK
jgi:hypothetical protein